MLRLALVAIVLVSACAALAQPSGELAPVWRRDVAHLAADRAAIRRCLAGPEETHALCADVVQRGCMPADLEAQTTAAVRLCAWRAIAAWEDVMDDTLERVGGKHPAPALVDAAQTAWEASMLADVRMVAQVFAGGSAEGVVAADKRARAVAARTIWLEGQARALEDQ